MAKNDDPKLASTASWPAADERMEVTLVDAPHPSLLTAEQLRSQCDLRTQRRSGPGGQHRNKTSSGAFLQHRPTGIVAEATERRSQADNRAMALDRLRYRLAVEVRTAADLEAAAAVSPEEDELRRRYHGMSLKIGERNESKPAVLALLLNDLHAAGGQPSLIAPRWGTTTSSVVRFVKSHPPALSLLNAIRRHHGRGPLK